jgi:hypothetical protein
MNYRKKFNEIKEMTDITNAQALKTINYPADSNKIFDVVTNKFEKETNLPSDAKYFFKIQTKGRMFMKDFLFYS